MNTLNELFLYELADVYDSERRTAKALPKMAKATKCEDLKQVIYTHLKASENHARTLETIFEAFQVKAKGRTCAATVGLLEEAEDIREEFKGSSALEAALIGTLQKIEHYEIAAYGCLHEWAGLLGHTNAAGLILEILAEEKASNDALIELARSKCNRAALGETVSQKTSVVTDTKPVKTRPGSRPVGQRPSSSVALTR
jgi:ferritin-like metal-binding protein YciE